MIGLILIVLLGTPDQTGGRKRPQKRAAPAPAAPQQQSYAASARVSYLEAALDAVEKAPVEVLVEAHANLAVYERGSCASSSQRLRVECLMTAGRRFCQKRPAAEAASCALYVDVVVSNLVAEKQLLPVDERYAIMKRAKDWRREMARRTRQMQGALAADFRLQMGEAAGSAGLATNIDAFCLATGDETNLSWQTCATSLTWFIAARGADLEPRKGE